MTYTKLFASITESSLWSASKETRLLFVSMLARANSAGFVEASVPGLARIANLTREETERALAELLAPDADDKSGNNDGRRLVRLEGGWGIVNYEVYRNRRDEEERREYMRKYMAQYRKKEKTEAPAGEPVSKCKQGKPGLAKAEAEAEAEGEGEREESAPAPDNGLRAFLSDFSCKLERGGESILDEWKLAVKGLRPKQVREILEAAKPGIQWPSEFKKHREARGV